MYKEILDALEGEKSVVNAINPLTGEQTTYVFHSSPDFETGFVSFCLEDSKITFPSHLIISIEQMTEEIFNKKFPVVDNKPEEKGLET